MQISRVFMSDYTSKRHLNSANSEENATQAGGQSFGALWKWPLSPNPTGPIFTWLLCFVWYWVRFASWGNNRRVHLEQSLGPALAEVASIWCFANGQQVVRETWGCIQSGDCLTGILRVTEHYSQPYLVSQAVSDPTTSWLSRYDFISAFDETYIISPLTSAT